ncbi:DnaJ domain-containing protein [Roseospira navarrensis]|uniref:DnaJ domain-containing protein n=1 Tax=Roseospira navarrensis TaxID=140058 RepID=A0A7X1ZG41_9PROT|nr:DnaJ domain-containing protein [Roseospira navarrensis]MQX37919.1 DnaJ domain-containing protein [Roseospira navarrensis]
MARRNVDPKGYYAILGITPQADLDAIKRAYRARAKVLHPDRNPSPQAAQEFNALTEAYGVLRDPRGKRGYDSGLSWGPGGEASRPAATGPASTGAESGPLGLRTCQVCGRATFDLRYRVLYRVRGRGLRVERAPIAGVFCRVHADRTTVAASLSCWALGWWAIPWGPVATLAALWRNLTGGDLPASENFQLLASQARAFLARGNLVVARRLAEQARRFAHAPAERAHVTQLLETLADQPAPRRRDGAPRFGSAQMAQIAPLLLIVAVAVYIAGPSKLVATLLTDPPAPATRQAPPVAASSDEDQGPVSGRTRPSPPDDGSDAGADSGTGAGPFVGRTQPTPPAMTEAPTRPAPPLALDPAGGITPGALHAVRAPAVAVLAQPDPAARTVATLSRSTVLMVTEVTRDGAWSRVLTAKGVSGFVASDSLARVASAIPDQTR